MRELITIDSIKRDIMSLYDSLTYLEITDDVDRERAFLRILKAIKTLDNNLIASGFKEKFDE